VIIFKVKDR